MVFESKIFNDKKGFDQAYKQLRIDISYGLGVKNFRLGCKMVNLYLFENGEWSFYTDGPNKCKKFFIDDAKENGINNFKLVSQDLELV